MNRRDLRPLDPAILSLLASEKIPVVQPDDIKARAFALAAMTAARTVRSPPRLQRAWRGVRARIALAAAGAVLAVAAVGSAAFYAWQRPVREPGMDPGDSSSAARVPRNSHPALQQRSQQPLPQQLAAPQPASIDAEEVAKELPLLAGARVAVTHGNFETALDLISQHGRLFPEGPLAEEREALRVRSLLGLGRGAEARRAAAAFRARFPRSVFLAHMNEVSQKPPR